MSNRFDRVKKNWSRLTERQQHYYDTSINGVASYNSLENGSNLPKYIELGQQDRTERSATA